MASNPITSLGSNSYVPPCPSRDMYSVARNEVVKAERNSLGTIIGEFVAWKYTVKFGYKFISGTDFHDIKTALDSGTSFFDIDMTFWNPYENDYESRTFYCATTTADMSMPPPDAEYQNVEYELIEV